jgi:uncharacterized membrane protein
MIEKNDYFTKYNSLDRFIKPAYNGGRNARMVRASREDRERVMNGGWMTAARPWTLGSVLAPARRPVPRGVPVAVAKTLSFAAVHFAVAFAVVFALTGSALLGGAVALTEPACNIVAYYLYEKAWMRARRPIPRTTR